MTGSREGRLDMPAKESAFIIACLLAGIIIRTLHLFEYASLPVFNQPVGPDVIEYYDWARHIISGAMLWDAPSIHAPLYPYFLACLMKLSASDFFAVRLLQLLLNLLAALPFFIILRDSFKDDSSFLRFVPHVFLAIFCIYPPMIAYQSEFISESILIPILSVSMLLLHMSGFPRHQRPSKWLCAASGLFAGLAIVAHPLSLFFTGFTTLSLAFNPVMSAFKSRAMKWSPLLPAILFGAAAALPITPVSAYNTYLSGNFVLVQANSGFNLHLGNNPAATGLCNVFPGPDWEKVHSEASLNAAKLGLSKDSLFIHKTFHFIMTSPLQWISLMIWKAVYSFNATETSSLSGTAPLKLLFIHKYLWTSFGLIASLALAALAFGVLDAQFRQRMSTFMILMASFWIGMTLLVVSGRYRLPMLPALFAFAAYSICLMPELLKSRRTSIRFAGLLLIASAIVFIPPPPEDSKGITAQAENIYGEACLKAGLPDEAIAHLQRSLPELSNWDRTYSLLGQAMLEKGLESKAADMFQKAIEVNPSSHHAFMNLAVMNSSKGDFDAASRLFHKAIELNPKSADTLFNMAFMEQRRGNSKDAKCLYRQCLELDTIHRRALNNYAILLLRTGRPAEAIPLLEKSVILEPRNPRLLLNLAVAQLNSGREPDALKSARLALKLDPESAEARSLISKISLTPQSK